MDTKTKNTKTGNKADDISKSAVRNELNRKNNSRGRGVPDSEKRRRYDEYEKRKKVVFELEKRNKEYLVLFLASDGVLDENKRGGEDGETNYYILGGNSALIYANDIAAKIGRIVTLHPDEDKSSTHFRTGIARIKGLEKFTKALSGIGITRTLTKSADEIVYFKLPHVYTKNDLQKAIKQSKAMRKEANELLQPVILYPTLNKLISQLRVALINKCISTRHEYRELLATPIIDLMLKIKCEYLKMARGMVDERAGLLEMRIMMDRISDMVALIQDLNLWDVLSVIRIAEIIVKIQKNIDELIAAYDNQHKKSEKNEINAK